MNRPKPELMIDPARRDWDEGAPCQKSPELFFPEGGTAQKRKIAREAIAICAKCPVITECLTEAIVNREPDGVWGGLYGKGLTRYYRRGMRREEAMRLARGITEGLKTS